MKNLLLDEQQIFFHGKKVTIQKNHTILTITEKRWR